MKRWPGGAFAIRSLTLSTPEEQPVKHPEAQRLVEETLQATGAETVRELARRLGYAGTDRERRLYSWATGESAPNMYGTLDLLRVSGRLVEPELAQPAESPGRPVHPDELAAAVAALSATVDALRADLQRLETRAPEVIQPPVEADRSPTRDRRRKTA